MHKPEQRILLRREYLSGLPLSTAAAKIGVHKSTARRWMLEAYEAGDDWDKFKAASLMVSGGGLEQSMRRVAAAVVLQAESTLEHITKTSQASPMDAAQALGELVKSLCKAQTAMKRMMPETNELAVETSAVKAFSELILKKHPNVAEQVLSALDAWANGER